MTLFQKCNYKYGERLFLGKKRYLYFREAKSQLFAFSKSQILRMLMRIAKKAMLTP